MQTVESQLEPARFAAAPRPAGAGLRMTQLDALRGLAALTVFWSHALGMMTHPPGLLTATRNTPLHFFYDGHAAVLLFFVLSGFVLNLKYCVAHSYPSGWAGVFIVRRVCRIYPAFFASLVLALVLRLYVFEPSALHAFSSWFSGLWRESVPWKQVARLLTLVGPNNHPDFINPPLWSLVLEMRISLFFPLIILAVNGPRRRLWDGLLLVGCYVVCFFLVNSATFFFLPCFVLGAVCAKYFEELRPWLAGLGGAAKTFWLIGSLLLYEAAIMFEFSSAPLGLRFLTQHLVGLGAAGLILGCGAFGRIGTLLNRPLFQFIGRTSYSFYLVHMVILIAVAPLVYRVTASYAVSWGTALLAAYLISAAFYRFVEQPGVRCGAWLSRRMAKQREKLTPTE